MKAVLNNDVVGGSCGSDGVCDAEHVRVFSEGVRADADEQTRAQMRSLGGGNDSPSRNLSRFLDQVAERDPTGLDVRQIWRSDRMGRGGDHLPFLDRGYPAIRLSVAIEDYEHQHQDLRVEDGVTYGDTADEMDFDYLADVTRLNVRTADLLASSPMPPMVQAEGAVQTFTRLQISWAEGAESYAIYRRRTDESDWDEEATIRFTASRPPDPDVDDLLTTRQDDHWVVIAPRPNAIRVDLAGIRGDDWIFGVSSMAANGAESPVSSAVPGGQFYPLPVDSED